MDGVRLSALDLGDDRLPLGHEAPGPQLAAEGPDANAELTARSAAATARRSRPQALRTAVRSRTSRTSRTAETRRRSPRSARSRSQFPSWLTREPASGGSGTGGG